MSVEGIQARIIEDAKKQAGAIVEEAKKEAEAILKTGKSNAEEHFQRQADLLDERYRQNKERTILSKRLELRKKLLDARQRWMDTAFDEAYQALVGQDDREYRDLMVNLIAKVSSHKDEEIIFGKKGDKKILKEIVDRLNSKSGGAYTLSKERRDFQWGFVLKRGSIETNMSIDSLFKYKRDDLEQKAWEIFDADV